MRPDVLAFEVAKLLAPHLPEAAGLDVDAIAELLAPPAKPEFGDLAFPCFRLAKALRNAPPKIAASLAAELAPALAAAGEAGLIAAANPAGPFLNFRLRPHVLGALLLPAWARGERPNFSATPVHTDQKIMVEYSQPNTHKAFHVGHMRNLCLGDALVRLLRATGHEVVAANYLGDVGTHVAKCLWGMEALFADQQPPQEHKGEWLGKIYNVASNQLEDWEKAGKDGDTAAAAKYAAARARMTEILRGIETRDPVYRELWERTRQWSLDEFDQIYAWAGVEFDRVFYESEVDEPGLALVDEFLQKGVFVESQGAVGIENPEIEHMPFFMLRKSDGTGLYATKDLALARTKFEEFGVDRSIYVVDARQSDHFRQVFLTLKKMGFAQAELCEHVAYEMVELPDGAMSSRKGNIITIRALREQLAEALWASFFTALRESEEGASWTDAEFEAAIHQVSLGAIKYGMLNRDNNQKIVFDMAEWTKVQGGDGGPTLQYVCARSASLLRKADERGKAIDAALVSGERAPAPGTLGDAAELALMREIINLPSAIGHAASRLRPSILCSQLYTLSRAYNRFQQQCNVLRQDDEAVLQARLLLVQASREALAWGLSLLGIPAPERM
ncbi:arginine--tRNA ligase [Pseudenhygromyxa sp. WMMC2535]|uniref:arginine--tRNA ligase n=1 Tax=Pseudenhygromyxa sp. WMMC2535 TaxID=2712867 RepID=UPI001557E5AD|nr:arginine--tRNA ligase [Pseudenhygromyxa sp. WMMC2535]NVB39257.1 arginine--tRNA ligase [Pseudenhygromyxa sp. WMMC2535]